MIYHIWPLCYSSYYNNPLYLGDSNSEDSPEYAVVTIGSTWRHHGVEGREIGRIKPRELNEQLQQEFIRRMNSGSYDSKNPVQVRVEPKWNHCCEAFRMEEMLKS